MYQLVSVFSLNISVYLYFCLSISSLSVFFQTINLSLSIKILRIFHSFPIYCIIVSAYQSLLSFKWPLSLSSVRHHAVYWPGGLMKPPCRAAYCIDVLNSIPFTGSSILTVYRGFCESQGFHVNCIVCYCNLMAFDEVLVFDHFVCGYCLWLSGMGHFVQS